MRLFLTTLLYAVAFSALGAISVTLGWDRNPEPDVTGYVVYYGNYSRFDTNNPNPGTPYPWHTNTANVTNWTVYDLLRATNWFFALTATNLAGLESLFSNEVGGNLTKPSPPGMLRIESVDDDFGASIDNAPSVDGPWAEVAYSPLPPPPYEHNYYRLRLKP